MQPISSPSKKFFRNAAIVFGLVALLISIQTNWFRNFLQGKKEQTISDIADLTVREVLEKDSNKNSIPDWEERLWGLDPTVAMTDGISNKTLIEQKREQLQNGYKVEEVLPTETDKLGRSIFALTAALRQSNADLTIIKEMAEQIGTEINTDGFANRYRLGDVKTVKTTPQSLTTYHQTFSKIYTQYTTIGSELPLIATVADTGIVQDAEALARVASEYQAAAANLSKLATPIGIAQYHLGIINSLDHIGSSIQLILLLEKDAIQGIIGSGWYGTYTVALSEYVNLLEAYLTDYSII